MIEKKPIQHRMTRRAAAHDYTRTGIYHITLHVADGLGQPLGAVVGSLSAPDGSADAPRTALSPVGQMVEHELLTAIHDHYPMVTIQDYVIMPEHLHCLVVVEDRIISKNGTVRALGDVITGFKVGCNRQYWEIMQRTDPAATLSSAASVASGAASVAGGAASVASGAASAAGGAASAASVAGGSIAGTHSPLFAPGYCDVMPIDAAQLATQRAYIAGNPRSRLLRMTHRALLSVKRGSIATALTPAALRGFLQRECPPHLATPDVLAAIESRLLIRTCPAPSGSVVGPAPSGNVAGPAPSGSVSGGFPAVMKPFIVCDTFGDRALLTARRCLPVVCHRKDAARFEEQKQRCLTEAAHGAVLVSACISPREREILTECANHGFPVIIIHDNGFPDRYHPSADRLDQCMAGRLLIVTPWKYHYRGKNEQVTVLFCKAMNCVAQALCHTKDNWWKNKE